MHFEVNLKIFLFDIGPKFIPFYGNLWNAIKNPADYQNSDVEKYPKFYVRHFGAETHLIATDPEIFRKVQRMLS